MSKREHRQTALAIVLLPISVPLWLLIRIGDAAGAVYDKIADWVRSEE